MPRPRKEIDADQFDKLCALQCTKLEIAGWFDCSEDTIENWCHSTFGESFSAVFAKKREAGKISLRRAQWKLAEKSASMAIFLGKNYLGQEDAVSNRVTIDSDTRQTVEDLLIEAETRSGKTETGD